MQATIRRHLAWPPETVRLISDSEYGEYKLAVHNAALIVAAGRGVRLGADVPKQYLPLGGRLMLRHSVDHFLRHTKIDYVQVVISAADKAHYCDACGDLDLPAPVMGGSSRQASVLSGLEALAAVAPNNVLIHDAARPFLSGALIDRILSALEQNDAVIPALPVVDSLKQGDGVTVGSDIAREGLYRAQTPQAFRFQDVLEVHQSASSGDFTDDASLFRTNGKSVAMIEGSETLFKITSEEDLQRARSMLSDSAEIRTGQGFDVHRFTSGHKITLCGVEIAHEHALLGHSDADVAMHALTDALLGALGAGDIGQHFPPSDERWRDEPSASFLRHAAALVAENNGRILNLDLTIICEAPKIGPHREAMRQNLAEILTIRRERVSVKATTSEGLGFTGRGEGIAAQALATVEIAVAQ